MRSSKRACSSTSATACLPRSVASISAGHQRRVVARAVHGLLDREHVRIGDGLLDEALDRGREGVVGVVDEHVAFAHRAQHVGAARPRGGASRGWVTARQRLVAQLRVPRQSSRSATARPCRAGRRPGYTSSSSTPSRPVSEVRSCSEQPAPTSTRTISPKRRRRSSSSTACSRSAASSETSRSASRVTRKTSQSAISMPGNSASRWLAITSSSGTSSAGSLAGARAASRTAAGSPSGPSRGRTRSGR